MMLKKLQIAKYRFVLEAVEPMHLPRYKGATLRGAFGQLFKKMACVQPNSRCGPCPQKERCAYSYVFETAVPPDSEVLRTHSAVPRPFVFEPPLTTKQDYQIGDEVVFGLVLVGHGIDYFPYFVLAFKALGDTGMGRARGRFILKQVWAEDAFGPWQTLVYDGLSDALRNVSIPAGISDVARAARGLSYDRVTVHFVTPTLLKHAGRLVFKPDFHVLVRALLRRISSLSYFHCGERWETDYRGLVELAQTVQTAGMETEWERWDRFSGKQNRRIPVEGIIGQARYVGPLTEFLELLLLGSVLHVGKGCVFGNGLYEITDGVANV